MILGLILYLLVGIIFLTAIRGYCFIVPPHRLVKVKEGCYQLKDYIPMPYWLWCIVLTIIWLPYVIFFIIMLVIEIKNGGLF